MSSTASSPSVVRALLSVLLALAASAVGPAVAAPPKPPADPPWMSEARLRRDFAAAVGIPAERVKEVHGWTLTQAEGVYGIIVGRYAEHDGAWLVPVLAVYIPCGSGTCIRSVHLGGAADEVWPMALVDLAVAGPIDLEAARYHGPGQLPTMLPEPAARARAPAVVLAATRARLSSSDTVARTDLMLVTLERGASPFVVLSTELEVRHADATVQEMRAAPRPADMPIGHILTGLAREGDAQRQLVATTVLVMSRHSLCLPPKPWTERLQRRADGGRYEPVPGQPPAPLPCHR